MIVEAFQRKRELTRALELVNNRTAVVADEVGGVYDRLSDKLGGHVIEDVEDGQFAVNHKRRKRDEDEVS